MPRLIRDKLVWTVQQGVASGIETRSRLAEVMSTAAHPAAAPYWVAAADAAAVLRGNRTSQHIKRFKLPTDDLQDWNLNPDNASAGWLLG